MATFHELTNAKKCNLSVRVSERTIINKTDIKKILKKKHNLQLFSLSLYDITINFF